MVESRWVGCSVLPFFLVGGSLQGLKPRLIYDLYIFISPAWLCTNDGWIRSDLAAREAWNRTREEYIGHGTLRAGLADKGSMAKGEDIGSGSIGHLKGTQQIGKHSRRIINRRTSSRSFENHQLRCFLPTTQPPSHDKPHAKPAHWLFFCDSYTLSPLLQRAHTPLPLHRYWQLRSLRNWKSEDTRRLRPPPSRTLHDLERMR